MLAFFLNPKLINGLLIKSVNWPIHRLIVSPGMTDQLPFNDILNIAMCNHCTSPKVLLVRTLTRVQDKYHMHIMYNISNVEYIVIIELIICRPNNIGKKLGGSGK
jgi:hypothetical protein